MMAVRALRGMTGAESDAAFAAIVEENEIRSALSQYKRGRIALIAAKHGALVKFEEA